MNKLKALFVAASLLLLTVGVFAGSHKFTDMLYAYDASTSTFFELSSSSAVTTNWSKTGTIQAQVTDKNGATFPVYYSNNTADKVFVLNAF